MGKQDASLAKMAHIICTQGGFKKLLGNLGEGPWDPSGCRESTPVWWTAMVA